MRNERSHRVAFPVMILVATLIAGLGATRQAQAQPPADAEREMLERGRYMVVVGGCNDCHTPGYPEAAGQLPESQWLTGVPIGFQGPWGTSYATNLRLSVQSTSEDEWLKRVRSPLLPPMPWFSVAQMQLDDARAMYRFIKSLGPAGRPAPTYVGPGGAVTTPVIDFVPRLPPGGAP
jgi:mono/diheme cytochrome c family protein